MTPPHTINAEYYADDDSTDDANASGASHSGTAALAQASQ